MRLSVAVNGHQSVWLTFFHMLTEAIRLSVDGGRCAVSGMRRLVDGQRRDPAPSAVH